MPAAAVLAAAFMESGILLVIMCEWDWLDCICLRRLDRGQWTPASLEALV
jgi:hypothetical protein